MTLREWTSSKNMQLALGAVLLGIAACAFSYYRGVKVIPLPAPKATGIAPGGFDAPPKPLDVDVIAAVSQDIFSITRKAPPKRFRLPGEAIAVAPQAPPEPTVYGIGVTLDNRPFCACSLSFHYSNKYVGDTIGTYTVTTIERGRVVFTSSSGKVLERPVPRTGS